MSDIVIEHYSPSNPEHARMFATLNFEWLERFALLEEADRIMLADPEKLVLHKDGTIIFARIQGQIAGTGALLKHSEDVYEIAKMAVTGKRQGQGIGRKIAETLIDQARSKGIRRLYIASNRKLDRAVTLYRSLGFKETEGAADQRYMSCDITLEMELQPQVAEVGGRGGLDPVRYGDWEISGKCVDF